MLCDVSADTFCILYPLLSSIELSFVSLTFVFVCFRHNRNHYPFAAHIFGSEYCHIVVRTFKLQASSPKHYFGESHDFDGSPIQCPTFSECCCTLCDNTCAQLIQLDVDHVG